MNSARTCSERAVLKSGMKNILEIMEFNVQKNEMKHVVMEFEKHSSLEESDETHLLVLIPKPKTKFR